MHTKIRQRLFLALILASVTLPTFSSDDTTPHKVLSKVEGIAVSRTASINAKSKSLRDFMVVMATQENQLATIKSYLENPGSSNAERERLTHEFLHNMRVQKATPELRKYVQGFETYENKIMVWHEEGPLGVPLYPIKNKALGLRLGWIRQDSETATQTAISEGDSSWLNVFSSTTNKETKAQRQGTLVALEQMPLYKLETVRAQLINAQVKPSEILEPLTIVAERQRDGELLSDLLENNSSPRLLKALQEVPTLFDSNDAFEVLKNTSKNTKLASAAIFKMNELLPDPDVENFLIDNLETPKLGATVASVLAKQNNPIVIDKIAERLMHSEKPLTKARCVLALRLNGSAQARDHLAAFVEQSGSSQLSSEVQAWLAN